MRGFSVAVSVRILGSFGAFVVAFALALAPSGMTPARAATEHVVDIRDMRFAPRTLTIAAGDTVIWTNSDSMPHTATSEDDAFDSGNLDEGQSFSFTFTEPGTYEYRCDYHSEMTGTIVVEAGGGSGDAAGGDSSSPDPSTAANPNTAMPLSGGGMQLPALLMGLGLLVIALSVLRLHRRVAASAARPGGGWNR
jgi:plastocyanin